MKNEVANRSLFENENVRRYTLMFLSLMLGILTCTLMQAAGG